MKYINSFFSFFNVFCSIILIFSITFSKAQTLNLESKNLIQKNDSTYNLYKNPYNDVSLLSIDLLEEYNIGTRLYFNSKLKKFTSKAKDSTIEFFTEYKYDSNGFLSETVFVYNFDGETFTPTTKDNLKFTTIKSKSGITYIIPDIFLKLSLQKKYRGKIEDFNEKNLDIEEYLMKLQSPDINDLILEFDKHNNLIFYRDYHIENDSLNKKIILKKNPAKFGLLTLQDFDKSNLNIYKELDYNLNTLKTFENKHLNNIYSYNDKGDVLKYKRGSNETIFSPEYDSKGKIIKTTALNEKLSVSFYYDEKDRIIKIIKKRENYEDILDFEYYVD